MIQLILKSTTHSSGQNYMHIIKFCASLMCMVLQSGIQQNSTVASPDPEDQSVNSNTRKKTAHTSNEMKIVLDFSTLNSTMKQFV